jgi:putative methionine-R-sulfoxide reductase with GAF domain
MNFWRKESLNIWGTFLLVILSIIFFVQYFVLHYTLDSLTEAERKIDFARSIQVKNQQIALQAALLIQGKEELATELVSALDLQDHLLHTLGDGGRMKGTDLFVSPLSRLPRITFDNLLETWGLYKEAINILLTESGTVDMSVSAKILPDSLTSNSIINLRPEKNIALAKAKLITGSQWLSLSGWYDALVVDLEAEVAQKRRAVLNWLLVFILADISGLIALFYFFKKHVLKPLKLLETNTASKTFSTGFSKNEIGEVAHQINETIEDLKDATDFVVAIGEGKFDLDYKSLSASYSSGKNKLADSLIEMQARLKTMNDEERKRQWANEGLAKFVDILRSSNDNLTLLGDKIIAALVQYSRSNQGGLYILNDEDVRNRYLELISLYAFDIKKFEQQKVKLGEGILGQTFLEKETTYLTDLPESYIRITSGLGDANPKSILMVPLKVDTHVYGILELASFNEYLPHEIAFVEKLGESIASTLASVKGAQKNLHLIEQFQQQTEQMRAQEEEMRQSMEELQATQEEIERKEKSYLARIKEFEEQSATHLSAAEKEELKTQYESKEREYQSRIEELKRQLAEKPAPGEDWELAREVEKTLQINLQALQITEDELRRKVS